MPQWVAIASAVLAVILLRPVVVRWVWLRDWRRWLGPAFLRDGRCAACTTPLPAFGSSDALVRCPNCDAQWREPEPIRVPTAGPGHHEPAPSTTPPWAIPAIILLVCLPIGLLLAGPVIRQFGWVAFVPLGMLALLVLCILFIVRTAGGKHWQAWACKDCGYDLRGSSGSTCPECGRVRPASRTD